MQRPSISMISVKPHVLHVKKRKSKKSKPKSDVNNIHASRNQSLNHNHDSRITMMSTKEVSNRQSAFWSETAHPSMYTCRKSKPNDNHHRRLGRHGLFFLICSACCVALFLSCIATAIIFAIKPKTITSNSVIATTIENSTTMTITSTSSQTVSTTIITLPTTSSTSTNTSSTTAVTSIASASSSTSTSIPSTAITSTSSMSPITSISFTTSSTSDSSTVSTVMTITSSSITTSSTATSSTTSTSVTTLTTTSTTTTATITTTTITTTTTTTTKTTTTTTAITTTVSCSGTAPSNLVSCTDNSDTNWTPFSYIYTATKTSPLLMFGVDASVEMYNMLDDISVVDTANSSFQLLNNPSFENSSIALTGWDVWCSQNCGPGTGGNITSGSSCRTGNCYKSHCTSGGTDYLVQSFTATVTRTYNITFWFKRGRDLSGGSAKLYVAII